MAELNGKLADTEKALAGVKADLDAATKAAAEQKAALEQQITDAKGRIANLEQTLATERKQNEEARIAADQASRAALAYQRDLYTRFSDIGAKETEQGMLLRIAETEVQFPVSKATLPKGDLPSLDRVARLMTDFPKLTARIEGHTDASGREETNLALSQARADAVKQALVDARDCGGTPRSRRHRRDPPHRRQRHQGREPPESARGGLRQRNGQIGQALAGPAVLPAGLALQRPHPGLKRTVTTSPVPAQRSDRLTAAPWSSAICLTIASPNPLPAFSTPRRR